MNAIEIILAVFAGSNILLNIYCIRLFCNGGFDVLDRLDQLEARIKKLEEKK